MAFLVVVSPLFRALSDKLRSLALEEVGLIWGVDQEMNKLADTLSTIQNVLHDAEEKQVTDKAVAVWLAKLRALAYDAEDILEEWEMDASQLQLGTLWTSGFWRMLQVCSSSIFSCFCFEQISLRRRMAKRVNELEQKFEKLDAERSRFQLREGVVERRPGRYVNQETSSRLSQQVYGRDKEREYVIGQLLDGAKSKKALTVCPIVGIGGLGKTTVAQYCFKDKRVQDHFEVKVWVCVSDDFDVTRLTKKVIESITKEACNIEQLEPLQNHLEEKLANKRFLLVLDDVWSEDPDKWSRFTCSLKRGAVGSSIIVTTRLPIVASITKTCPPCSLELMSADDCWDLFRQHAFDMGEEESPNLVEIGKQIVEKCGGVPLAARVLGSLMRFQRVEKEWLFVKDSEIWNLPQSENNTILPALRLSYSHLSPELKQCFAYCSVFPKDYQMPKEDLIDLWIANNLIQPEDRRRMEDTGDRIYEELLLRSFFQDVERSFFGTACRMHDLLHDLACSINPNECCHLDEIKATTRVPGDIRHLSVRRQAYLRTLGLQYNQAGISAIQSLGQSAANLRTFLLLLDHGWGLPALPHVNLACLSSLRALSLSGCMVDTIADTVSKLKHLRYLDISHSEIESLPELLCELRNLQTLKLMRCYRLRELPKGMGKMSCLRHLRIEAQSFVSEMPAGIGKLTCLQTLGLFAVGTKGGQRINELQGLDDLRGTLTIKNLQHVKTSREAREANLIRKQNILRLLLEWSSSDDVEHENDRDVFEGLKPHSNLEDLRIFDYRGVTLPSWFEASSLRNLVDISMLHCKKCEHLPSALGKLPSLRSLDLYNLPSVKFLFGIKDEIAEAFLSLESLSLYHMPELEDWFPGASGRSEEVILFPRLSSLHIQRCARLRTLPGVGPASLTTLSIPGCPNLSKVEYQHLNSLQKLTIGHDDMTSLPDGVQHVSSTLRQLWVITCPALISLPNWIGTFTELRMLRLQNCRNLRSLPDGLQHLTNLQHLEIEGCYPELHGRYKKNTGEDWPKIAHIPDCLVISHCC